MLSLLLLENLIKDNCFKHTEEKIYDIIIFLCEILLQIVKTTMQNKIISSEKDVIGTVFFGTVSFLLFF